MTISPKTTSHYDRSRNVNLYLHSPDYRPVEELDEDEKKLLDCMILGVEPEEQEDTSDDDDGSGGQQPPLTRKNGALNINTLGLHVHNGIKA